MADQTTRFQIRNKASAASLQQVLAGMPGGGDSTKFLAMDGTARTPAGGGGSGLVLIDSGTISSPVDHFDIDIPGTGAAYLFRGVNLRVNVNDDIVMLLGFDGNILCDDTNYDSYVYRTFGEAAVPDGFVIVAPSRTAAVPLGANIFELVLFPGDDVHVASGYITGKATGGGAHVATMLLKSFGVKSDAAVVPTPARATSMRWRPYDDGTAANPPTNRFIGGSYFLFELAVP